MFKRLRANWRDAQKRVQSKRPAFPASLKSDPDKMETAAAMMSRAAEKNPD